MTASAISTTRLPLHGMLGRTDVDREFAEALRVIAGATRSGSTLEQALTQAAARTNGVIADSCRRAAAEMVLGVPVDAALEQFAQRAGTEQAWLLARVVGAQHRRGGDLGRLCHRLARLLHERRRLREEARAATAQARFTARAVVALPAFLVLGWAWISPQSLATMVTTASLLVASPALVGLLVGVAVIRRLAASASVIEQSVQPRTRVNGLLAKVSGTGSVRRQQTRLATYFALPTIMLCAARPSAFMLLCAGLALGCALGWPVAMRRREISELEMHARRGLPDVLETSVALLAAGCTPREVLETVLAVCPGRLGVLLRPALHQMELGRTPFSALTALPVICVSPELEAWAYAMTDGTRHGAPISETLESLLRDVRTADREEFRARAATAGPRIQLAVVLLIVPSIMWLMLVGAAQGLVRQLGAAGIL
jgi:Flp pilus assembly protein TadB